MKRKWLEVLAFVIVVVIVFFGGNSTASDHHRQHKHASSTAASPFLLEIAADALYWMQGPLAKDCAGVPWAASDSCTGALAVHTENKIDSAPGYAQCDVW